MTTTDHAGLLSDRDRLADRLAALGHLAGQTAGALRVLDPANAEEQLRGAVYAVGDAYVDARDALDRYVDARRDWLAAGGRPDTGCRGARGLPPVDDSEWPRRCSLYRSVDPSGVSGTGTVVLGVVWPDGLTVARWRASPLGIAQVELFANPADLTRVHGHAGRSQLLYHDRRP